MGEGDCIGVTHKTPTPHTQSMSPSFFDTSLVVFPDNPLAKPTLPCLFPKCLFLPGIVGGHALWRPRVHWIHMGKAETPMLREKKRDYENEPP